MSSSSHGVSAARPRDALVPRAAAHSPRHLTGAAATTRHGADMPAMPACVAFSVGSKNTTRNVRSSTVAGFGTPSLWEG